MNYFAEGEGRNCVDGLFGRINGEFDLWVKKCGGILTGTVDPLIAHLTERMKANTVFIKIGVGRLAVLRRRAEEIDATLPINLSLVGVKQCHAFFQEEGKMFCRVAADVGKFLPSKCVDSSLPLPPAPQNTIRGSNISFVFVGDSSFRFLKQHATHANYRRP